jgi:negative regulator of replication initiation
MPTIRVDEGVWAWLKEHARPLEDTPNSVLRRIAGLDAEPPSGDEARRLSSIGPKAEKGDRMDTAKYRYTTK